MMSSSSSTELQFVQLPFLRRNNPFIQVLLSGACLFCNPGLYLAITGLGAGGGKVTSTTMADISNGVLYGLFTFSALLGGTMINTFGPRITMMFGVTGYPIYIGGLWYFDSYCKLWFPVLAGAYLGITAGCLWSVAGFMGNAYAEESQKGTWRAIQWSCNASGATIGGFVALGINLHTTSESVPHSVYIIFIVLQICSVGFAALMLPPKLLLRSDGTALAEFKPATITQSLSGLGSLFKDWRIILMLPTFYAGEVFLVLQSSINAYAYNLRTRSLNNVLTNIVQIPFTLLTGHLLDNPKLGSRRQRGMIVVVIDAVFITGTYIAQTIWLASWKFDRNIPGPAIDWTDSSYPGAVIIYLCYGAQYGMFQNTVLWLLGSLTNQPSKTGHMVGLFVSVLSAGTASAFGIDSTKTPYERENGAYFALATISWPILFFIAWKCTTDSNYFCEEGVGIPIHVQLEHEKLARVIEEEVVGEKVYDQPVPEGSVIGKEEKV
ncbi:hypothetical protein L207DRAFT_478082 [Hyaloscypha variabilis F]|uniref:MFS general substrate transporter n=1 Tax=Hyaloscypha variabilis (strain UAMH 11265 / GT02V1 / F) TaxID=1149755 RepID=A0A2J6S8P7_HYAVF|nr:hypothetical protein L207DRAFT_478082 [Hyaloscypha variabilis F]